MCSAGIAGRDRRQQLTEDSIPVLPPSLREVTNFGRTLIGVEWCSFALRRLVDFPGSALG